MAKTITAGLKAHLQQETTTLATCWRIVRRDGVEFHFTDHDRDLVIDGDTYSAESGYSRTAISNNAALSVDNLDLDGIFDDESITLADLRAGKFDYASVYIFMVNWADLTQGKLKLRRGTLGEMVAMPSGIFHTELRGMTEVLNQQIVEVRGAECPADLGDSRCKMPINPDEVSRSTAYAVGDYVRVPTSPTSPTTYAQYDNRIYRCVTAGTTAASAPTYDTTVGNQTSDGTATFEAEEAWTRHATVASVTDNRTFTLSVTESRAVDDWFNHGALFFDTGNNAGVGQEIKDWVQSSSEVTLFLPMQLAVEVGDAVRLYPGCDKRFATCKTKFDNVVNFRGYPHIPGQGILTIQDGR